MTNRERYQGYYATEIEKPLDPAKPYRLFAPDGRDLGTADRDYLAKYEVGVIPTPTTATSNRPVSSRHPSSERFHAFLKEMGEMHDKKQKDYGTNTDPFANVRASHDFGLPAWIGCMVRANDKMVRLKTFAKTGQLSNEGARDSFMDLAVYAIIGLCLFEETQK